MTCRGCGAELSARHQKVFCSNRCQREFERRRNIAEWLATGVAQPSSGVGHYVRVHLLEEQAGACALCGCPTTWQGAELRLVCPNCDSQLPTFKARNRGNGRAWRRQRYADGKSF